MCNFSLYVEIFSSNILKQIGNDFKEHSMSNRNCSGFSVVDDDISVGKCKVSSKYMSVRCCK